jgi:hypothetical protein
VFFPRTGEQFAKTIVIGSDDGLICIQYAWEAYGDFVPQHSSFACHPNGLYDDFSAATDVPHWHHMGIWIFFLSQQASLQNDRSRIPPGLYSGAVGIPFWLATSALAVLPLIEILTICRWSGKRYCRLHGLCAKCGYDLRATPDRCPECGTVPPK